MPSTRRPPRLPLTGRTVVVTGAARGIGAAVAGEAAARGARVAVVDVDAAGARARAAALPGDAAAFCADVRDVEALHRAAADVVARFGGIDVLVANAGVAPPSDSLLTIDPGQFERTVEINLLGQWRTLRAMLPFVAEARGHVALVASIYAFFNGALATPYAASKAGVEQLGRALRVELAPHGATAGVAYYGFVETDLVAAVFAQPQVGTARRALPGFLTRTIPAERAARVLVDGVEARAPRTSAPGWVGVALAARGLTDPLADRIMAWRLSGAVREAEAAARGAAARPEASAAAPGGAAPGGAAAAPPGSVLPSGSVLPPESVLRGGAAEPADAPEVSR